MLAWILCVAAATQSVDDAAVAVAKAEMAHVQSLVESGVLPPVKLDQARDAVADAEDGSFLRRMASNGTDLNVEQADATVAAEDRRVARRQKAVDEIAPLVESGAAARVALDPLTEDLAHEKTEAGLVESRAKMIHEIADMAAVEATALAHSIPPGSTFLSSNYAKVEQAYRMRFGKPLPVSAMGQTAVHRALGFDHRGRVDVALNPDQPEGVWLMEYLKANGIPFIAFRGAVPGKATGAHIHIGPGSTRLASGG
jgi:hypothetical protein